MQIRDPNIAFVTENDTGIVALSVTWEGLAAREDDQLVVSDPFDSGFDIDRAFRVTGPAGYELVTVSPPPTARTQATATWAGGTSLDGFEAHFVAVEDSTQSGTGADGSDVGSSGGAPGFGLGIATLAIVASLAILSARNVT
ncbi:hypothetical protein [Haloarchaeobius sp. HME9146]|uniref:DUF7345 domain-containing protein n=1 Tax=Haloarchaeobius sp. HME9146 TaxID=2978732 RepID=UPI0021BE922E|nr:hypothetical protein [Haloarchaeobius sp. HME9146]MCT9098135.1 hypothetical protein [Haloarchaeobius sp. HME9146]